MLSGISVNQSTKPDKAHAEMEQVSELFAALEAARCGQCADKQDAWGKKSELGSQHDKSTSTSMPTGGRYRCVSRNGVAIRSMPTEDHNHQKSRGPSFGEEIAVKTIVTTEQACGNVDYLQLVDGGFCPMALGSPCWEVNRHGSPGGCRVRAQPDLRSAVLGARQPGTRVYGTLVDCPMGGYPWVQLAGGAGYMLTQSSQRDKNLIYRKEDSSNFFERVGSLPSATHAKFMFGLQEGDLVDVDLGSVSLQVLTRLLKIRFKTGQCSLSGQDVRDLVARHSVSQRWAVGKVLKNHVDVAGLGQLEVTVADCEQQSVEAACRTAQEMLDGCLSSVARHGQRSGGDQSQGEVTALLFCHELERTVRPLGEHTTENDLQHIVAAAPEVGSELEVRLRYRPVLSASAAGEEEDIGKVRAQVSQELRTLTERLLKIDETLAAHQQSQGDVVPVSKPDELAIATRDAFDSQPDTCNEMQKKICEVVRSFWSAVDGASHTPAEELPRPVNLFESAKRKRFVSITPTDDDSLYRLTFLVDEHYRFIHVRVVQAENAAKVAKMAYLPLKSSEAFCYEHTWLANCTEDNFEEVWKKNCPVLCVPPYGVCDYATNGFFTQRCGQGTQRGPQLRIYERLTPEQEADGDTLGGREIEFYRASFSPQINVMAPLQLAEISAELKSPAELNLAGKICVVNRGGLSFVRKALIAQSAGAVALIIVHNESGILRMGGDKGQDKVTIPVVSVQMREQESLAAAAAAGHPAILNLKRHDGRLNLTDDDWTTRYTFGPPGDQYIMYEHNRFAKQAQDLQEEKIQIQDDIRVLNHRLASLDGILAVQRRLQQGDLDRARWTRGSVIAREKWVAGSSLLAVEPQEDLDEATPREAQELASAVTHIWTPVRCGVANDEGARMTSTRDDPRYFCGRWFDRYNPNGNGQCGPDDGQHQCASCKRYETLHGETGQLMTWSWRPVVDSDVQPPQNDVRTDPGSVCRPAGVAILTHSVPAGVSPPTSPVAWISADINTTVTERMAACTSLAHSHPQQLVGRRIVMLHRDASKHLRLRDRMAHRPFGFSSPRGDEIHTAAVIRGYSADLGMHIVRADTTLKQQTNDFQDANSTVEDLATVDLRQVGFLVEPSSVPISEYEAVAALGTHTHVCTVCFCIRGPDAFKDYCFGRYKVDGHQVDVGEPRHPLSICGSCVRTHVKHELEGGKLVVRCPFEGCGRALQTRELANHTTKAAYEDLVGRIRDSENTRDQASIAAVLREAATAGVELRRCPKCKVLIEKNQGCSSMRCYRCDHEFTWHRGEEIPAETSSPEASLPTRNSNPRFTFNGSAGSQPFVFGAGAPGARTASEPNGTANQSDASSNTRPFVFRAASGAAVPRATSESDGPANHASTNAATTPARKAAQQVPDGWIVKYSQTKYPGKPYYVRLQDGHRQWEPPRQYGKWAAIAGLAVSLFFIVVLSRYVGMGAATNGVCWTLSWAWWLVAAPFAAWRSTIWCIDCAATLWLAFNVSRDWWKQFVQVVHRSQGRGIAARVRFVVLREDHWAAQRAEKRIHSWLSTAAFLPLAAKVAWLFPCQDDGTGGAIASAAVNTQGFWLAIWTAALALVLIGVALVAKRSKFRADQLTTVQGRSELRLLAKRWHCQHYVTIRLCTLILVVGSLFYGDSEHGLWAWNAWARTLILAVVCHLGTRV